MKAIDQAAQAYEERTLGDELRLLVLAGSPPELISRATGIEIETVRRFEELHFDVRERLGSTEWLVPHVVEPLVRSRGDDYPLRLRLAMGGGPEAAIELYDAPLPPEKAAQYAEREKELSLRRSGRKPALTQKKARQAYASLAAEYAAESERLRHANEEALRKTRCAYDATLPARRREGGSFGRTEDGGSPDFRATCRSSSSENSAVRVSSGAAKYGFSEAGRSRVRPRAKRIDKATKAKRAVWGRICGMAVPFRFRPPFEWLQPNAGTYAGFENPAAALETLQAEFSDEDLISAKAAVRDSEGVLRLAKGLGVSDRPFLAILDRKQRVLDILTQHGLLSGELPLSLAIDRGEEEQDLEDEYAQLLLPLTVERVAFFRALGIPATTPAGLACLTQRQLDRLQEQLSSGYSTESDGPRNPYLAMVFVDWPPSTPSAEPCPTLSDFTTAFCELHRSGRLDTFGFYFWSPDETEIERWSRTADRGDVAGLRAAVHRGLGGLTPLISRPSFALTGSLLVEEPKDLAGALQRHRGAGSGSNVLNSAQRARAAEFLTDRYRVAVGDPLIASALDSPDPLERSDLLQQAQLAEIAFLMGAELRRHAEHGFASASPEEFARRMKVMDGYLDAQKLLMAARTRDGRCRTKRETIESVARRTQSKGIPETGSSLSD